MSGRSDINTVSPPLKHQDAQIILSFMIIFCERTIKEDILLYNIRLQFYKKKFRYNTYWFTEHRVTAYYIQSRLDTVTKRANVLCPFSARNHKIISLYSIIIVNYGPIL